ncbi:Het domain protein [Apiospora aurea]|uniref:Het domain protein n=1 Tax=Apiospora aurea TaxID=335848 RepID=A0ABR1QSY7_9PEZI
MEHLFWYANSPEETKAACRESTLAADWNDLQEPPPPLVDPKTPWLGFDHDSLPFVQLADYPTAAGFNLHEIWCSELRQAHGTFQGLTSENIGDRASAFLQSWLFFGLLESVVDKKIRISYFTRDHDEKTYLYTRNLHFCLQSKVFSIRANPETKLETSVRIQKLLLETNRWVSRFAYWGHPSFRPKLDQQYPTFMNRLEAAVPAIVRLAEAIEETRLYSLVDCPTIGTLTWHYSDDIAHARKKRLQSLGWCDFQIKMMEETLGQSTIDWIAASHLAQDPKGHKTCKAEACARNDIDPRTYEQSHRCAGLSCEKLPVDLQRVVDILNAGGIPIVSLRNSDGRLDLAVRGTARTSAGNYIAFSHVWADGLGGATEIGLNRCQVQRLDKLCRKVRGGRDTWFWLDCLCIPSKKAVGADVYYKALEAIRDVYINASMVLVIDKTIEECTTASTCEQLYARVYLSAWMQRMWTYEEAVLAKDLRFVLQDGVHVYSPTTLPSMRRTVAVVWQNFAAQLYRLRVDLERLNIGHIYRAFRYRLTNVPQEEFLSVAGMLDLDTGKLLRLKGADRTRSFWLALRSVPSDVPFLDCPKLSENGFRWAPATMMHPSSTLLDTEVEGRKSLCTGSGLLGVYLTVSLKTGLMGRKHSEGSIFYVWVDQNGSERLQPARWWREERLLPSWQLETAHHQGFLT